MRSRRVGASVGGFREGVNEESAVWVAEVGSGGSRRLGENGGLETCHGKGG